MVVITTCNREGMLLNLLDQIHAQYDGVVMVVDDGTRGGITFDKEYNFRLSYHRFDIQHGKARYYEVISYIFNYLKHIDFDYLWQLPDDISITDDFFKRSVELWESIQDEGKICLSTGHTHGRHTMPCWTEFNPIRINEDIWQTQWQDLCYIATKKMLSILKFDCEKPDSDRWKWDGGLGSGVGAILSRRLVKYGNMYHVDKSLVDFIAVPSQMHV